MLFIHDPAYPTDDVGEKAFQALAEVVSVVQVWWIWRMASRLLELPCVGLRKGAQCSRTHQIGPSPRQLTPPSSSLLAMCICFTLSRHLPQKLYCSWSHRKMFQVYISQQIIVTPPLPPDQSDTYKAGRSCDIDIARFAHQLSRPSSFDNLFHHHTDSSVDE